jgi:hypothetical protein
MLTKLRFFIQKATNSRSILNFLRIESRFLRNERLSGVFFYAMKVDFLTMKA